MVKLRKLDICSGTTAAYTDWPQGYRLAGVEDIYAAVVYPAFSSRGLAVVGTSVPV